MIEKPTRREFIGTGVGAFLGAFGCHVTAEKDKARGIPVPLAEQNERIKRGGVFGAVIGYALARKTSGRDKYDPTPSHEEQLQMERERREADRDIYGGGRD